jgi:hypothetical protein
MTTDDESTPKSGATRKLQEIDEEIARYNKTVSKKRWVQIDAHWREYKENRKILVSRLQSLLTADELRILGIY